MVAVKMVMKMMIEEKMFVDGAMLIMLTMLIMLQCSDSIFIRIDSIRSFFFDLIGFYWRNDENSEMMASDV